MLRAAFVEEFGTNIAQVIQRNLTRLAATNEVASTPPPKPKRSFLQRVTGVFGRGSDTTAKAEKDLTKADRQALGQVTPELMEGLLDERIEVTDEELRRLMASRARWVQDWLLQNGQVPADRLLLVAPKTLDATYQGECRVTLSLN